jgi:hypothetical protein
MFEKQVEERVALVEGDVEKQIALGTGELWIDEGAGFEGKGSPVESCGEFFGEMVFEEGASVLRDGGGARCADCRRRRDRSPAPRHAWVWLADARLQVEDLGGGTLLNGPPITERVEVVRTAGDRYEWQFVKTLFGRSQYGTPFR